ncbi:MAG TPA: L-threonylcarbamoyladenylate synthase [Candidatus Krumholzibacteria bacterium]|nr:L-threonylcarbamoyladenylate synthase [Candidatus Krumholzibacteria bacterium]
MTHDASIAGAIDDPGAADVLHAVLAHGGVAVVPTDTLYGLSCVISSEEGVRRISAIKRAPNDRRYILLASSLEMVERYVASFGCGSRALLEAAWPAPLSVILPSGAACPAWAGPTVAVRIPALEPLCELIERLGEPIVSTSVNRTGTAPMTDAHEIRSELRGEVDLIVTGPVDGRTASTIVDLSGEEPRVLRDGSYDWDALAGDAKPSK